VTKTVSSARSAQPPHPVLPKKRPRAGSQRMALWTLIFLGAHVPLAVLIFRSPSVSMVHALITLLIGLWFAISSEKLERVAVVGAYIVGAEVLWRMSNSIPLWEFGKYATALIFTVALVRRGQMRIPGLALLYFALLIPSIPFTFMRTPAAQARIEVSFNLSGPFALMISVWFFSHLKVRMKNMKGILLAMIGPAMGVGIATFTYARSLKVVEFGTGSNLSMSGGYGQNQVSAILGLGALVGLLFLLVGESPLFVKLLMGAVILFMTIQSALTFSRGGLYNAGGAVLLSLPFLFKDRKSRLKVILLLAILVLVAEFAVLPRLNTFTGGALAARFRSTNLTGRDRIALADLEVWRQNFLFGVGPGEAREYSGAPAHTEFVRLLAEHGLFGLLALVLLLYIGLQNVSRARTSTNKAVAMAALAWSCLFMLNEGMRLGAPALMFGLSSISVVPFEIRALAEARRRTLALRAIQKMQKKNLPIPAKAPPLLAETK
jgi:O-antigen ligase